MADMITIEGSRAPSVELATGERRTVRRTERIDRLIARGFVTVVEDAAAPEEAAPKPVEDVKDEPAKAPRRTAAAKDTDVPASGQ
jgi:hypothetical protein